MDEYIPVENNTSLVRDPKTGAILNTNAAEYSDFSRKRNNSLRMRQELEKHAAMIKDVQSDISDIKLMLAQLLNRG